MKPFEPLWLRILRAVSVIVLVLWAYMWAWDSDYRDFYRPMDPIRTSIEILIEARE